MLHIALLATNQDHNLTIGGDTEESHIHPVADELLKLLQATPGINVVMVLGKPESKDAYSYEGLRAQQVGARGWLHPLVGDKLCLNLHSDSGTTSHVGYYWRDSKGQALGAACAERLKKFFATTNVMNADYSDYIFATYQEPGTVALLLELGSHQNQSDYDKLKNDPKSVATIIVAAIQAYYNLGGVVADWAEIEWYARWSLERIKNHEDPRDGEAFAAHLRAIGKLGKLSFYGYPCPS